MLIGVNLATRTAAAAVSFVAESAAAAPQGSPLTRESTWLLSQLGNPVVPGELTNEQLLEYQYPNDRYTDHLNNVSYYPTQYEYIRFQQG